MASFCLDIHGTMSCVCFSSLWCWIKTCGVDLPSFQGVLSHQWPITRPISPLHLPDSFYLKYILALPPPPPIVRLTWYSRATWLKKLSKIKCCCWFLVFWMILKVRSWFKLSENLMHLTAFIGKLHFKNLKPSYLSTHNFRIIGGTLGVS